MSKTQPWWKMRKPFKVALGITAGPLLIVGFLALLLLIPTQTDEALYATKPPVPKKVEEPQPLTEEQEARRVAALRRAAATRLNKTLRVSRSTWPGEWPLTVSQGTLECKDGQYPVFV